MSGIDGLIGADGVISERDGDRIAHRDDLVVHTEEGTDVVTSDGADGAQAEPAVDPEKADAAKADAEHDDLHAEDVSEARHGIDPDIAG